MTKMAIMAKNQNFEIFFYNCNIYEDERMRGYHGVTMGSLWGHIRVPRVIKMAEKATMSFFPFSNVYMKNPKPYHMVNFGIY